jgi:hypothetical protein
MKAKNSAPSIRNIPAELKKHKIRKRTECTGFRDNITMKAEAIIINENK